MLSPRYAVAERALNCAPHDSPRTRGSLSVTCVVPSARLLSGDGWSGAPPIAASAGEAGKPAQCLASAPPVAVTKSCRGVIGTESGPQRSPRRVWTPSHSICATSLHRQTDQVTPCWGGIPPQRLPSIEASLTAKIQSLAVDPCVGPPSQVVREPKDSPTARFFRPIFRTQHSGDRQDRGSRLSTWGPRTPHLLSTSTGVTCILSEETPPVNAGTKGSCVIQLAHHFPPSPSSPASPPTRTPSSTHSHPAVVIQSHQHVFSSSQSG